MLCEYTLLGVYAERNSIGSLGAHVYCNVQKSQENVRQKHHLCQFISEICMVGLHRPDGVFLSWKQEILRWESRFMGGRRFIARDVCVGDA